MAIKKKLFLVILIISLAVPVCLAEDPFAEAKKFTDKGRYEDALKLYMKVKQVYPGSEWVPKSIFEMARIYEKMKRFDDASAEYKNLIEQFPHDSMSEEAYFSLGRLKSSQNNFPTAIKAYELYVKNYPSGQYSVIAYFNVASLYRDMGNQTEALKYYNQILKYYQNDVWFYSWAAIYSGDIYTGRKDYDRAIESYQMVVKSEKNNVLYSLATLHRGQCYMEKNDFITAKAIFNDIIKTNNNFQEEALYGLGKSHYKLGEYEMAREIYTSMLQMFPNTVWKINVEKGLKLMDKKIKKQRTDKNDEI
jgi:tetratricopeptide (TPR) repeat protein